MLRFVFILALLFAYQAQGAPRYLSKNGSDSNGGTSWGDSWLTWDKVQTTWSGGDTLIVGAGVWREYIDSVQSGTHGERTVIIDSAWLDSEAGPLAWIYGSDIVTGWDLSSGSIYKRYTTETVAATSQLFQGDSLIWSQLSLSAVTEEGEWYWNGTDTMYLWAVGSGDPDSYEIEFPTRAWVTFKTGVSAPATDFASIVGMGFRYTTARGISMDNSGGSSSTACDSVFIDHCDLSYAAYQGDVNPTLIFSGQTDVTGERNRVRSCDMSNVWSINPATLQPYSGGSWGSATAFYSMSHMTVDSNNVHGFFTNSGIYFKGGYGTPMKDSNVIAHNTVDMTDCPTYSIGIRLYSEMLNTRVHNNVIIRAGTAIQPSWGGAAGGAQTGYGLYFNNTIFECITFVSHINSEVDNWGTRVRPIYDTIKFNVIYSSGTSKNYYDEVWTTLNGPFFDSNMYYSETSTLEAYRHAEEYGYPWTSSVVSWSDWQTVNLNDVRSSSATDPAFADTANVDFSRSAASSEMDRDGNTIFGAVQNAADPDPVVEQISGKVILSGKVK